MRVLIPICLFASLVLPAAETDPILLLRKSQENRSLLVPAVQALTQAIQRAEKEDDEAKTAELNACLFWARKRLNLQEADALAMAAPEAAKVADAVIERKVETSEAQAWLTRADAYAKSQTDPLLKAIRYYEVAHRFQGSPEGLKALEKSLASMRETKVTTGPTETVFIPTASGLGSSGVKVDVTTSQKLGDGWSVFVDGEPVVGKGGRPARTPCTIRLPVGEYQIAVAQDGRVDPHSRQVTVGEGGEYIVEIKGLIPPRPGRSKLITQTYGKFLGRWVEEGKSPEQAHAFTVELSEGALSLKDPASEAHSLESVRLSESEAVFRWSAHAGTEAYKMTVKNEGRIALFSHYAASPEIGPGIPKLPARATSVTSFAKR